MAFRARDTGIQWGMREMDPGRRVDRGVVLAMAAVFAVSVGMGVAVGMVRSHRDGVLPGVVAAALAVATLALIVVMVRTRGDRARG
jgi:Flp pilus assembly protein TadB